VIAMNNSTENEAKWYVVQTYSGYENKVLYSITQMIENMNLKDVIFEVKIPIEEAVEIKNGHRKVVQHKLFPGYVMIKTILTKQALYLIRNTRGVTGFLGTDQKKPTPLTNEEIRRMGIDNVRINIEIECGDVVDIVSGPLAGKQGTVSSIDVERQKAEVILTIFNSETPMEIDFIDIVKSAQ